MKAFYGRSSLGGGKQENSIDIQLAEVVSKFGDMDKIWADRGISGSAPVEKRPALLECLDQLGKGDILHVYSFSRVARDTFLHLFMEKQAAVRGFTILSVAEEQSCGQGAEKKLFRTLIAAMAEYERSLIATRTRAARNKMSSDGRFLGGRRQYGWEIVGKNVEPLASEQAILQDMISKKRSGASIQSITDGLNNAGTPSATGASWNYHSVRHILKREIRNQEAHAA